MIKKKEKEFDIGIMGFWFGENYGSLLTYYSLYKTLEKMGKTVAMIERPTSYQEYLESKNVHSRKFTDKHFNITTFRKYDELQELNDIFSTFILGSDQVFNPDCYKTYRTAFFFSFADNNKSKIAYACSFGRADVKINLWEKLKLKYYLGKFTGISVREDCGIDILNKIGIHGAKHVIDPIFLSTSEDYQELIDEIEPQQKDDYILSYILDPDKYKRELILLASDKLNKEFINILDGAHKRYEKNKALLNLANTEENISVQKVVSLYKNAKFIITDSFHGTCLALIFKKPFISIANKGRGYSRFESLLNRLNLLDRLFYDVKDINLSVLDELIDYNNVYKIIDEDKKVSIEWLKNALNKRPNVSRNDKTCFLINAIFNFDIEKTLPYIYYNYFRCVVLAKLNISKKREHYEEKRKKYKSQIDIKWREG